MINSSQIRVTAVQLGVIDDVQANLETCCRLIDQAAQHKPDIIVLPEFCNHLAWYENRDHSYEVAVSLDGNFLKTIGTRAAAYGCFIMINCTVRRPDKKVTGTNLLLGRDGRLHAQSDKQVLMGNENNFLEKATQSCEIVTLPFGNVGMYSCMDGVMFESSRGMAVRGAQLLLNSLNSFAKDEGSLHIPVRAAENKLFVVAANKVGALVPPHMLDTVAARLQISPDQLHGGGHSQIVAPDGTVLAKAPAAGEAVIMTEIDLNHATNKLRPDGTDIMASRRLDLYQIFKQQPQPRQTSPGAETITTAVFQPTVRGKTAVSALITAIPHAVENQVRLITLPELCHLPNGQVKNVVAAVTQSNQMLAKIQAALAATANAPVVATTIVEVDGRDVLHTAVLIGTEGILLRQPQLHTSGRTPWVTALGQSINTIDLPWGRVGLVAGNDAIYPETFRLLVLQDVEVVAVPTQILEEWEYRLGLLERSAENRINLVVGSPSNSLILTTDPDFTLWTTWEKRPFDGNINHPIVTHANATGLTCAVVNPAATANRTISQKTNVVENRPWWLADALLE
ncbi:MAG: carbon-nitrogen hydrolase family protein [Chloroflexi bacterium]|nr:carbon-nitrogen hydrolase family protein [Chloroflexota bacterium]